jgi:hypothetical protein
VPVEIDDSCTVLLAHQHAVLCEKAKDNVVNVSRNFLRPVVIVYAANTANTLLLVLRNERSAIPDGVLHLCKTLPRLQSQVLVRAANLELIALILSY